VTPTILTAYIADQQRHYYAYATRRQRAILWIYLAISLTFLVTTSFRLAEGNGDHWNWLGTGAAWCLLVSSAAVGTWYALLGYSFRWITTLWAKHALKIANENRTRLDLELDQIQAPSKVRAKMLAMLPPSWKIYEDVVYRYCKTIFGLVVSASLATILGMILLWNHSPKHKPPPIKPVAQHSAQHNHVLGFLSVTSWPAKECKNCNLELRFVPSTEPNK
jgi:hypothetical protein